MKKIGLLSDTHGALDDKVLLHLENCDEIWHAGDFGTMAVVEQLKKPGRLLRGVYGNIDGQDIRSLFPGQLLFTVESLRVLMKHIGGYPGRYAAFVKDLIKQEKPGLFISGHSHILKIIYDDKLHCLHMNPGAAGNQGWHHIKTIIRFEIHQSDIRNCEVIELGKRGIVK